MDAQREHDKKAWENTGKRGSELGLRNGRRQTEMRRDSQEDGEASAR